MTHVQLALSPRLLNAINIAAVAHRNQYRKGTAIPYVSHVFAVMNIASAMTDDEDILIACLLHDVLEDAPDEFSAEQIEETFGPRVLDIVGEVTKDESLSSWQERSDATCSIFAPLPKQLYVYALRISLITLPPYCKIMML